MEDTTHAWHTPELWIMPACLRSRQELSGVCKMKSRRVFVWLSTSKELSVNYETVSVECCRLGLKHAESNAKVMWWWNTPHITIQITIAHSPLFFRLSSISIIRRYRYCIISSLTHMNHFRKIQQLVKIGLTGLTLTLSGIVRCNTTVPFRKEHNIGAEWRIGSSQNSSWPSGWPGP